MGLKSMGRRLERFPAVWAARNRLPRPVLGNPIATTPEWRPA